MIELPSIHKAPSIPEAVLEEIRKLLAQGKLRPGDHLPSELELAEHFGVGRSSIREAMRVLQLLGVVEVIQGKGTFVREPGILPLMVGWSRAGQMGVITEVMEARQFMEVLLARLAAERATEADIAALQAALKRSEESRSNIETNVKAGVDFHLVLADATHNQILALMYRTISDLYLDVARRTRITPEIALDRFRDHERLLQAISNRDPEAAARAMEEHIQKAYQILASKDSSRNDLRVSPLHFVQGKP